MENAPLDPMIVSALEQDLDEGKDDGELCHLSLLRHYANAADLSESAEKRRDALFAEAVGKNLLFSFYMKLHVGQVIEGLKSFIWEEGWLKMIICLALRSSLIKMDGFRFI